MRISVLLCSQESICAPDVTAFLLFNLLIFNPILLPLLREFKWLVHVHSKFQLIPYNGFSDRGGNSTLHKRLSLYKVSTYKNKSIKTINKHVTLCVCKCCIFVFVFLCFYPCRRTPCTGLAFVYAFLFW